MNVCINTILLISFFTLVFFQSNVLIGPHFGVGIKIGEVTQSEAIVWVPLTETAERVGNDATIPNFIRNTGTAISERTNTKDGTHFDSESVILMGSRYAIEMKKIQEEQSKKNMILSKRK